MNCILRAVATHLFTRSAGRSAGTETVQKIDTPIEGCQRCRVAKYLLGLTLFASVCAALALSASRVEAVTFAGNVGYQFGAGNTVVLTAHAIQNNSSSTSGYLVMHFGPLPRLTTATGHPQPKWWRSTSLPRSPPVMNIRT
jgi:hypothetical protein